MNTIGRHVLAELYGCHSNLLSSVDVIRREMLQAARVIGATVMGETFHQFAPQGVSGTVVIAESHLSIHTWPEAAYAAIDIYTCGQLDPRPGMDHLAAALGANARRLQEIVRGLPEELDPKRAWVPEDVQIITHSVLETLPERKGA